MINSICIFFTGIYLNKYKPQCKETTLQKYLHQKDDWLLTYFPTVSLLVSIFQCMICLSFLL